MPSYPPFRDVVELTGREVVPITVDPDADDAALDLAAVEQAFAAGARTLLLCNPHNPLGRVSTRQELADLAELARSYGVRVVTDEVHGPLTLAGSHFTPYLSVDEHAVLVTSATKSFNMPAVHGALIVALDPEDRARLVEAPIPAQNTWSSLGVVGRAVAWRDCDDWHAALVERLVRPARPARRPGRRPVAARADAAARGDLPRLARPAGVRRRRPGRGPGSRTGCGSHPARTTSRACPATCGSTSRPVPSGWSGSSTRLRRR